MKHLIIGTAGHIDHGKTSLIKLLTGVDCDTHKEEKTRGITINLGFSHLELPSGENVGIIDVPGHKDFINNMIGGACGIDMVLLVIAADSGIMPQTVEHINIIKSLGIKHGVVALTKIDLVDEELIEIASDEISEYLNKTELKDIPIVGISTITGMGKDKLLTAIDNTIRRIEEKDKGNLFRMYIDRIFTIKGHGSVVTGSVTSGSVSTGDEVFLLPGIKQKLKIRSIERHGIAVNEVERGDRAAINLTGLKNEDFERGMLLSNKELDSIMIVDAYVNLFESVPSLNLWSNVIILSGTYETTARMHLLNKDNLAEGEDAIVQLHLNKPGIFINRDKIIIRNSSDDITLGGGYIIDSSPLHHRKRTPQLVQSLTELCVNILTDDSLTENIKLVLNKEFRPFSIEEICELLHVNKDEIIISINKNHNQFLDYKTEESFILISNNFEENYKTKIIKNIKDQHSNNNIFAEGLETGEIAGKLGLSKSKTGKLYLELLLEKLKSENTLDNYKKTWIIKGHKPVIDKKTESEIQWLQEQIAGCKDEKPVLSEIEEAAVQNGINKAKIKTYLSYLANSGKVKIYNSDFIYSEIFIKNRDNLLKSLSTKPKGINIPEFKEIIPGTKKFRALIGEIMEFEKLIQYTKDSNNETTIIITQKGKEFINAGLS
ncbi:MAG TPA: selenocysteine-specific translation elongation factor [Bacteroidales bacterium]|nr:selenocysteine-specific translation elongation factor [Bacteroidales bacterium]